MRRHVCGGRTVKTGFVPGGEGIGQSRSRRWASAFDPRSADRSWVVSFPREIEDSVFAGKELCEIR